MLTNLSRPSNNGHTFNPYAPDAEASERQPFDAGAYETAMEARMSRMEARMSRIEAMIEALVQDRGLGSTPQLSIEYGSASGSGPRRNVTPFSNPAIDPMLAQMQHQLPHHIPVSAEDEVAAIHNGNRGLPFPGPGHGRYPMPNA